MPNREIYFAGGCFWGVEEYFSRIPGVLDAVSGYAQSRIPNPDYRRVCSGSTNAAETVRVLYDPEKVDLPTLVRHYFKIIDPLAVNRQGNDVGTQYRSGIYYADQSDRPALESLFAEEQKKWDAPLATRLEPLENFYQAEDYHQDYLKKNPGGYCHVDFSALNDLDLLPSPTPEELKQRLSPEEYHVTQENGTEAPFTGKYWNTSAPGIYVDVITGDPLFLSSDKFDSGCGWPSFTRPARAGAIREKLDTSHGMIRTEARGSRSDAHLGHIFDDGPNGLPRYCINSAALRFIPLEEMAKAGYGQFIDAIRHK